MSCAAPVWTTRPSPKDAAEGITGRALTEGQLRCLLTIYDYLGLDRTGRND